MKTSKHIQYITVEYQRECRDFPPDTDFAKIGYGIAVYSGDNLLMSAEDISDSRETAEALAEIFNSSELDPIHFEQAIEDFLTDLMLPK